MSSWQTTLSQLDHSTAQDVVLLSRTIDAWDFVCAENERDRTLVTESQWQQWVSYRDSKLNDLSKIIDEFDNVGSLTNTARKRLIQQLSEISGATHKSSDQLLEENREVANRMARQKKLESSLRERRAALEMDRREKAEGWRGRVGSMFAGK